MNRACRQGCVPLIAAVSLSLGVATTANAATALSIGATGSLPGIAVSALYGWQYTHNFWPDASDGAVTSTKVVDYPASIGISPAIPMSESVALGMSALDTSLRSATGKVVIVCESQGCVAVTELLQSYEAAPETAPNLDDVVFVFVGNPSAPTGVAAKNPGFFEPSVQLTYPGQTPDWVNGYMFTREFDFFAYTPDSFTDPLVAINYAASFLTVHPYYGTIDPSLLDPNTWVKIVANTAYFVIPALTAPLLIPFEEAFRSRGWGEMFDSLNAQMLDTIRAAYESNLVGYVRLKDVPAEDLPAGIETAAPEVPTPEGNTRQTGAMKATNGGAISMPPSTSPTSPTSTSGTDDSKDDPIVPVSDGTPSIDTSPTPDQLLTEISDFASEMSLKQRNSGRIGSVSGFETSSAVPGTNTKARNKTGKSEAPKAASSTAESSTSHSADNSDN